MNPFLTDRVLKRYAVGVVSVQPSIAKSFIVNYRDGGCSAPNKRAVIGRLWAASFPTRQSGWHRDLFGCAAKGE